MINWRTIITGTRWEHGCSSCVLCLLPGPDSCWEERQTEVLSGSCRLRSSLPPRCPACHPGSCLTARWWLLLRPELRSLFFLDGMLGIFFFQTDYGYLKAGMQAVICISVKITLLVQTKGPPSSVCHHSIIGIWGTIRTGWAGRDTFSRKSFSSDRQLRGFQSQRQYILISCDSGFLPEICSNQFCSLFTPWFIYNIQWERASPLTFISFIPAFSQLHLLS